VHTFDAHEDEITSIYVHNTLLFTGSKGGKIVMWHAQDGTHLAEFQHESKLPIYAMCVIQKQLFSAGGSKSIVCWNMETYTPLYTLRGHEDSVTGLGFLVGKNALISSSKDGTFKIWPIENQNGTFHFDIASLQRAASFQGSYVSSRKLQHRHSSSAMSEVSIESLHSLQEQLLHTQELLGRQERNKLRLKGELSGTQSELNRVKMELLETRKKLAQTEAVVEELEAAKELLVTYSSDLQLSQEAHAISLELIFRTSDRQYHSTAMELVSFQKLITDDYSLSYRESKPKPLIVDRKWDFDEDWDSDRDVPESESWWRKTSDPYFLTDSVKEPEPLKPRMRRRQSVSEILYDGMKAKNTAPMKAHMKRRTIHATALPHAQPPAQPKIALPSQNPGWVASFDSPPFEQPSIDDIGEETLLIHTEEHVKAQDAISSLFRRKSVADIKKPQLDPSQGSNWSILPSWFNYGAKEP
jgi:hypothetical protein